MERETSGETNPMVKIIDSGLHGVCEASDALARVWRILLFESCIKGSQWKSQLAKTLATKRIQLTEKEAASYAGNITRTLAKPKISWNVLLQGFIIMGIDRVDVRFTLWKGDSSREIKITINPLCDLGDELEDIDSED